MSSIFLAISNGLFAAVATYSFSLIDISSIDTRISLIAAGLVCVGFAKAFEAKP